MGGYDLYGNYYPRMVDAENAEMAQCAAIDARIALETVEQQAQQRDDEQGHDSQQFREYVLRAISDLAKRIEALEVSREGNDG